MRHLLLLCATLFAASCSGSPTAPTPVSEPHTAPLHNLRWDVAAPGCPTQSPPTPLPDPAQASLEPGPHGAILARFPYRVHGRGVTLHATLIEQGTELLVCEWDIADL